MKIKLNNLQVETPRFYFVHMKNTSKLNSKYIYMLTCIKGLKKGGKIEGARRGHEGLGKG